MNESPPDWRSRLPGRKKLALIIAIWFFVLLAVASVVFILVRLVIDRLSGGIQQSFPKWP